MNWSAFLSSGLWVGLIAWLAGFRFRPTVEKLLDRVKSAGPTGLEFSEITQQVQIGTSTPPGELKPLTGVSRTVAIELVEKSLHQTVAGLPENERIDRLVSALAV